MKRKGITGDIPIADIADLFGLTIAEAIEVVHWHAIQIMEELETFNGKLDYVRTINRNNGYTIHGIRITGVPKVLGLRGNGEPVFSSKR